MAIPLDQFFVCEPSVPKSLRHFVDFWAAKYGYPDPEIYAKNIGGPR